MDTEALLFRIRRLEVSIETLTRTCADLNAVCDAQIELISAYLHELRTVDPDNPILDSRIRIGMFTAAYQRAQVQVSVDTA